MINLHEAQRAKLSAGMMALWVDKLICESRNSPPTSNTALLSPIEEDSLSESNSMGYAEDELGNASSMFIDACLTLLKQKCFKGSKVKRPACKMAAGNHSKSSCPRRDTT